MFLTLLFSLGFLQSEGQNARAGFPEPPSPMGIWELPDGAGGAVGINISAMGGLFSSLQIGVYQRTGKEPKCGEENFFSTQSRWQTSNTWASYTEGVLKIHIAGLHHIPGVDLNLLYNPEADTFRGRFHRASFDEEITLGRLAIRTRNDTGICTKNRHLGYLQ
jgi:hypothetical protein